MTSFLYGVMHFLKCCHCSLAIRTSNYAWNFKAELCQMFICHSLYWFDWHCLIIHGIVCLVVSELLLKSCNQPAGLYMNRQEFTGKDKKISLEVGHGSHANSSNTNTFVLCKIPDYALQN